MSFDFDLFVIGGGSGGVRAARVAAGDTGAKVALAEEDRYGGTCVIRGCVPKKLMVFASEFPEMAAEARAYGWDMPTGDFNWDSFKGKLHAELDRLEGIYRRLLANSGVETFDARAKVVDAHTVELSTGERKTAKHILLAMGGRPVKLDVPGAELAITSNDIFHLDQLPGSMLIVGGGYIASEFAGVMNGLGVKTTQFYRGEQILRGFDNETRNLVADEMIRGGIDLQLNTNVVSLERDASGAIRVVDTNGAEHLFDQVMFATGRSPNTDDMGLEEAGVKLGRKGEVVVDDYSQTDVPSIYAVGDVTDRVNLTPVAIREGMAFVDTVFKGVPTKVDHELIPTAIFTQPEIGTVGMGEEEAAAKGPIEVYATSFRPMRSLFAGSDAKVMMKLIVDANTRVVLGCHIVAPGAGEMIQLAGIAVKMGATKEDFDRTVAVHPTMSEEMVTMKTPTRTAG
ncbi:glutathione-disulfide reductase [Thalassovita mediterranea]|jgi:glutathione reductase (NADPH)|uniref:Glutathione reductase n=1 Tax=Thalassovita mediterranea TaxID=340021 RepID=A0A0N7M1Q0_9RHOB|nr:glutathione-disulfide reductase [Thalassovita mediterranea]CUH83923.1 Glutathione amide reductase [Thalassovita mediterranea]SIS28107.1 NADPH-glutathione reductase [Thalassovita mediterranea]